MDGFVKYGGETPNSKIVLNVAEVDLSFEFPRFPFDVLVYAPVKLIKYVDVNVMDNFFCFRLIIRLD